MRPTMARLCILFALLPMHAAWHAQLPSLRVPYLSSSTCQPRSTSLLRAQAIPSITNDTDFLVSLEEDEVVSAGAVAIPQMNWLDSLRDLPNQVDSKRLINFLLLSAALGYALSTILNVDHAITRGWTHSVRFQRGSASSRIVHPLTHSVLQEVAMRIPVDNWSHYTTSLAEQPIFTKTMINIVIYLLGDWLSQTLFAGKNLLDFDSMRTLRNGYIGMCFGPIVVLYYYFSDCILPMDGSILNRVEKIFMDQTIYLSVKCAVYIASVGMLQGESWETVVSRVQEKLAGIVFTAWKFWPLVHCVTYSVIPAEHRMLWVNSVDLVWNAILASLTQKGNPVADSEEEALVEAPAELPLDSVVAATSEAPLVSQKPAL